jgi:hypothetical protein
MVCVDGLLIMCRGDKGASGAKGFRSNSCRAYSVSERSAGPDPTFVPPDAVQPPARSPRIPIEVSYPRLRPAWRIVLPTIPHDNQQKVNPNWLLIGNIRGLRQISGPSLLTPPARPPRGPD